ncbi:MAG: acyl carrier protein [Deltaproteobacteria bacterium]|nr:acyl carrier protein [Deltaproteobacteria bacterium]
MNVFEEIKSILAEILDVEVNEVTPESYLIRELGAESIDLMELAAALNQRFRIEVNEEDVFLRELRNNLADAEAAKGTDRFPFLTARRREEIVSELDGGPVLKVKDVVSYVTWQLERA